MRILWIAVPLAVLAFAVRAERVDIPPAGLKKLATHIVVGDVKAVYSRSEQKGRYEYTHHVAEVRVKTVEKGEGLAANGLVYVRYWRKHWIAASAPPPGTAGHRGLPKQGETLRIYLARNKYDGATKDNNDGGFNVVFPNGFERIS